jgi:lysyl-tRNA synthetase class 1
LTLPEWAQVVLSEFEQTTVSHNEVQIAEALKIARMGKPDPGDEGWKAFLAEFSVFFFREAGEEHSIWKTYFAPMAILTKNDGTELLNPDFAALDADSVAHWVARARSVTNPLMRARYADAVWDLGSRISGEKRQYACAILAIDSYIEAVRQKLYSMINEEVQALRRALDLSLSLKDVTRRKAVAEAIFALYDLRFNPRHVSVWILPFDSFYGNDGILTAAQVRRLVTDLESVLARTSGAGKPEEIDPFAAKEAAERLARHYNRLNDKGEVERVIKTYGAAFETLAAKASPMLAMAWLQPVIERYEQEGLKPTQNACKTCLLKRAPTSARIPKSIPLKSRLNRRK